MGGIPRLGSGYDTFGGGVISPILKIDSQDDKGPTKFDSKLWVCTSSEEVMENWISAPPLKAAAYGAVHLLK